MEVIISATAEEASALAANKLNNKIAQNPKIVLGLATGGTPLALYKKTVELIKSQGTDISGITSFNLDEYVGVSADHTGSYAFYMKQNWLDPLGLSGDKFYIPNGMAENVPQECAAYEEMIKQKGPIDLQVLGIGRDGHIGFNEPGSSLKSRTRIKTLTEQTRQDNAKIFSCTEEIPRHVITMGVQTILESKEIILLAFGKNKAQAIKDMVEGPITAFVPASILQMHEKVQIFLDEEAASLLKNQSYYRQVFENKPPWQMAELI